MKVSDGQQAAFLRLGVGAQSALRDLVALEYSMSLAVDGAENDPDWLSIPSDAEASDKLLRVTEALFRSRAPKADIEWVVETVAGIFLMRAKQRREQSAQLTAQKEIEAAELLAHRRGRKSIDFWTNAKDTELLKLALQWKRGHDLPKPQYLESIAMSIGFDHPAMPAQQPHQNDYQYQVTQRNIWIARGKGIRRRLDYLQKQVSIEQDRLGKLIASGIFDDILG